MNSDFPQNEREQLEAKVTALLLGELSAEDAAALGKAMEQDTELKALYERLKVMIELVREGAVNPATETAMQPAPLKMSAERREKLLARFKTVTPEEFARPRRGLDWLIPTAIAAACVMILGALLLPALSKSKSRSMKLAGTKQVDQLESEKDLQALRRKQLIDANPAERTPAQTGGHGFALIGPAPAVPASSTTPNGLIVLPAGDQVAGNGRGETAADSWDFSAATGEPVAGALGQRNPAPTSTWTIDTHDKVGGIPLNYAESADVSEALRKLAGGGTNTLAMNDGSYGMHIYYARPGVLSGSTSAVQQLDDARDSDGKLIIFLPPENRGTVLANNNSVTLQRESQGTTAPGGFGGGGAGGSSSAVLRALASSNLSGYVDTSAQWNLGAGNANQPAAQSASAKNPSGQFPSLETRKISVDPNAFYKNIEANAGALAAHNTNSGLSGGLRYVTSLDPTMEIQTAVLAFFKTNGVDLNASGKSVFFNDRLGTITIHGTDEDLKKAEGAINALNAAQPSVVVNTRFVEINQQSNQDLGFNWYGQFTNGVTASGGTMPQSVQVAKADNASAEYRAAQNDLESKKRWRDVLVMKAGQEEVDKAPPKAQMVTIMAPAAATTTNKSGLGQKLRETLSGKVERTARIRVEGEKPDIAGVAGASVSQAYDPYFLQTEFETIQSHAVLSNVVASLNLKDVWGKKYNGQPMSEGDAEAMIKKNLDLSAVKNTKFIEIGVRDESPEEAARLANTVAQAYQKYRTEEYDALKSHGISSLQQQLAEQDVKVKVAQANVDRMAREIETVRGSAPRVTQNDAALPKPVVPPPTPQPEILTRENAVSTFSLNVSDVSFKLAAASLKKGQMPEPASIRSEEFINAFDYRDPDAGPGVPIAFAAERARYPFAHNRELLRFSLKTAAAGRQVGRPLNLVLLLDNSGSMERADRVRIIQEALRVLASQLKPSDTFSIVTFARTAQLRVDGVPGNQAAAAAAEIAKLTPEGGTNLGEALDLAYETALHHYLAKGDNRVVVLTDGAANLGDVEPETLKQKVEAHRKQGVALDCFGIGWEGYNDDLLEVLTRNGDGRYGFINSPEEASTTFVAQVAGALHVAAADVKVQVEFNPKRVTSYRQIGYAKQQLTKEQFRDNTVDAAEIAAQEAGNALYTIETNPRGEGSIATVRVRYKVPGTGEYREQAWDVPFTGGAVALEQASPAMRLAATASAFSEWLAGSPFATGVTTDQLLNYLKGVPEVYGADTRPKDLEWMLRQAKSISGE